MSAPRLASAVLFLLSACAGWDSDTPTYAQPPNDPPTPSHHVPPADPVLDPVAVRELQAPVPPVAGTPPATPQGDMIAVASVILMDDCPSPAPADPGASARAASEQAAKSQPRGPRPTYCNQSTVQLAVGSDRPGRLRIEAVRVLDPASRQVAGTAKLREPSSWNAASGTYGPWDEQVAAGPSVQTTYKLGPLDLSRANKRGGPTVDPVFGPFMLELDVSIDGRRQTVRSPEFGRHEPDMVVT